MAYYGRGYAYANIGECDEAITDFDRAIAIAPSSAGIYGNRANVYIGIGERDKAFADCGNIIAIDAKYATAYYNRGTAYAEIGAIDKAISDYDGAIAINPNSAAACYNRGVAYAERNPTYYQRWRQGLAVAASAPNIICKISGLGMADHHWTPATIRPYVLACIETFGPARSLFATNWPVDGLFSDYATLLSAYAEITAEFSADERRAMFSGNAERLYRI